jgi:hypothetical protein
MLMLHTYARFYYLHLVPDPIAPLICSSLRRGVELFLCLIA